MLLYSEVESYFANTPKTDIRMIEILRGIGSVNRLQVYRVLLTMAEHGYIIIRPPSKRRGGYATYRLKVCH